MTKTTNGSVLDLYILRAVQSAKEGPNPEIAQGLEVTLRVINKISADVEGDNEKFSRDPRLSTQGAFEKLQESGRAALADLDKLEARTMKGLSDNIAQTSEQLLARIAIPRPTDVGERIAMELRMQEIRSELRQITPGERLYVYLTTNDPVVIEAIRTAPPVASKATPEAMTMLHPFVDPEKLAEAAMERANLSDPEKASHLGGLKWLHETYWFAFRTARKTILGLAPGIGVMPEGTARTA